jgi:hypothetical protein
MRKGLVPVLIVLALAGLLFWQLRGEASVECRVCITFNNMRRCATAFGPGEDAAQAEALNNLCAQMAKGVTESVACGKLAPEEATCGPKK